MIATLRRTGLIVLAACSIGGPALADGIDNAGPAQAAGATAYSGSTRSPSGVDTERASDMAHSVGALPDQSRKAQDNGTPDRVTHANQPD
jgi:hypothetical protein